MTKNGVVLTALKILRVVEIQKGTKLDEAGTFSSSSNTESNVEEQFMARPSPWCEVIKAQRKEGCY